MLKINYFNINSLKVCRVTTWGRFKLVINGGVKSVAARVRNFAERTSCNAFLTKFAVFC